MTASLRDRSAPTLRWWVQRNPAYVLSAACIACGARMLLVPEQKPPAGDVTLMLTTLGVLQAYEMLVSSILIALRRTIRAPEDQPSILIIGTVFWSGPLIATMEMTAARPVLGFALALGACVVAIGELLAVARTFGWRLPVSTPAMAAAFLLIVACAQPMLRVDASSAGTHEALMYGLWWLVALVMVAALPSLRMAERRGDANIKVHAGIIAASAGAAMLHLYAIDHAFYGHARLFYIMPTLAAVAIGGMCLLRPDSQDGGIWFSLFFWLPVVGVYLSCDRFDPAVPLSAIPPILRDPLLVALVLAAAVWGLAYARHRWEPLQHAASLALVYASVRLFFMDPEWIEYSAMRTVTAIVSRNEWGAGLVATAWYLLVQAAARRSRGLAAFAVALHQIGVSLLIPDLWDYTDLVQFLSWGWTILLVMHLASNKVPLICRLVPIGLLLATGWAYAADKHAPNVAFYAQLHCGLILVVLAVAGWLAPWTRYRLIAGIVAAIDMIPFVVRAIRDNEHGPAGAVIIAGFLLLFGGLLISWHKQALLARLPVRIACNFEEEEATSPP